MQFGGGLLMAGGAAAVSVTVAANANNINLFTLCGSPAVAGTFNITINSGVTIGSTSTATAAVAMGAFPAGSIVTLINNGNIYGKEGAGGAPGIAGSAGGPAISLTRNLTINNTATGRIWGGGGGGGGGGGSSDGKNTTPGGTGGAGQGFQNQSAAAVGGAGGTSAGAGGTGGAWGATGENGGSGNVSGGAAGGAAGRSVALSGFTVTFTAGDNATQVRGPRS